MSSGFWLIRLGQSMWSFPTHECTSKKELLNDNTRITSLKSQGLDKNFENLLAEMFSICSLCFNGLKTTCTALFIESSNLIQIFFRVRVCDMQTFYCSKPNYLWDEWKYMKYTYLRFTEYVAGANKFQQTQTFSLLAAPGVCTISGEILVFSQLYVFYCWVAENHLSAS